MSKTATLAITIGLLVSAVHAQQPAGQRSTARSSPPNTLRLLQQRIPEITFRELPLEQVLDWLEDFTGLDIEPNWAVLEENGVEKDTPISIQARNLRLTQVLWMIMKEAGGPDVKLAYRASGNLLILSTEEDLSQEMITKIYDVADLLIRPLQASRQLAFDVSQGMGQTGQGGGSGAGGGMFGQGQQGQGQYGEDEYGGRPAGEEQMQKLVELITNTVEPDSWRENGGQGTIYPYQHMLVVRNTLLVHQRLGGYVTEGEAVGGP